MKLLGIDYGDRRLGLALGELGSVALPFKVLTYRSDQQIWEQLAAIVRAEQVEAVVVGWPRSLSGRANQRSRRTQAFVEQLQQKLKLPVYTVDERMTSKLYSRQGIKKDIDKHSAAAILETYLQNYER